MQTKVEILQQLKEVKESSNRNNKSLERYDHSLEEVNCKIKQIWEDM